MPVAPIGFHVGRKGNGAIAFITRLGRKYGGGQGAGFYAHGGKNGDVCRKGTATQSRKIIDDGGPQMHEIVSFLLCFGMGP